MAGLRRSVIIVVALLAPFTALVAPSLLDPAAAVTPGVGFTADPAPTYQLNGIGWSVAVANGVIYVGGTFSAVRPPGAAPGRHETSRRNFVALIAASGRPTGCRLSFTGTAASVRALAVSPDRRTLYAGGNFTAVNGRPVKNLAAVNLVACSPVARFHPKVSSWVHGLAVGPSGTVYAAGEFATVNGVARQHFAAVSPTGALLPWHPVADHTGYAVAVTPNGASVVLGGAFDTVDGADSHALAVVSPRIGALLHGYARHFVPARSRVKALVADATGIYTGNEGSGRGVFDGRIALNPRTFRQRWRDTCLGATQDVLVDRGVLYAANHAHNCASMGGFPDGRRQHLTVEGIADPHLKVWWPDTNGGIGQALGPRALAIAIRGGHRYLVAVGEFTTVNGAPQQGILRLRDRPDTGAPSAPSALAADAGVVRRIALTWRAGADRDDRTLTYRVFRNSSAVPLATLRADSDWWRRPRMSYIDRSAKPGATYTYRVTARDGTGNTSRGTVVRVRARSAAPSRAPR